MDGFSQKHSRGCLAIQGPARWPSCVAWRRMWSRRSRMTRLSRRKDGKFGEWPIQRAHEPLLRTERWNGAKIRATPSCFWWIPAAPAPEWTEFTARLGRWTRRRCSRKRRALRCARSSRTSFGRTSATRSRRSRRRGDPVANMPCRDGPNSTFSAGSQREANRRAPISISWDYGPSSMMNATSSTNC